MVSLNKKELIESICLAYANRENLCQNVLHAFFIRKDDLSCNESMSFKRESFITNCDTDFLFSHMHKRVLKTWLTEKEITHEEYFDQYEEMFILTPEWWQVIRNE